MERHRQSPPRAGAHHVVNYRESDAAEQIRRIALGGVDTIVEVAAGFNAPLDQSVLKPRGTIAIYANDGGVPFAPDVRANMALNRDTGVGRRLSGRARAGRVAERPGHDLDGACLVSGSINETASWCSRAVARRRASSSQEASEEEPGPPLERATFVEKPLPLSALLLLVPGGRDGSELDALMSPRRPHDEGSHQIARASNTLTAAVVGVSLRSS